MGALVAGLRRMIAAAPEGLATSALTRAQRCQLETFAQRTGAVKLERRGGGAAFVVLAPNVLERHLDALSPHWRDELPADLPRRSRNIAMTRSSKGGSSGHDVYHLLLKPIGQGAAWSAGAGEESHDLRAIAAPTGGAMIVVSRTDGWHTTGDLWLVENQAMFDRLDWLPAGACGSVSYFGGEIHGTLLRWLAARPRAGRVIVFPDYDGNGMSCFQRVANRSAAASQLYLFPGWESALERYGNPQLHQANLAALEALSGSDMDPWIRAQIAPVLEAMIRTGRALEQEAVWLAPGARSSELERLELI